MPFTDGQGETGADAHEDLNVETAAVSFPEEHVAELRRVLRTASNIFKLGQLSPDHLRGGAQVLGWGGRQELRGLWASVARQNLSGQGQAVGPSVDTQGLRVEGDPYQAGHV